VPNAKVCKAYMLWLLQSDVMQKQFIGDARTLAQPTLNVGMIRSAVASIPPLAEQYRIVEKIDEFMVLCDQIKAKMARAQALNERLAGTLVERSAS
jgi:type I restriction enzyme S subunit